ncbi:hypothetical protein GWI33_020119 [Rhynchophorus ferrugineus]|uniref:Uncharacterized protein n=1 Tax=Rhynchophorus ferrugineus TaxID=354439 RepID=A0A834HS02_RHYFE|nr:hypothetical protein GWI33_020119 [Rhynchophorus ferrugineus]
MGFLNDPDLNPNRSDKLVDLVDGAQAEISVVSPSNSPAMFRKTPTVPGRFFLLLLVQAPQLLKRPLGPEFRVNKTTCFYNASPQFILSIFIHLYHLF